MNLLYLVLGMFIETIPIIILTTPIFYPIALTLGIDPIHFGVITVFNLAFGMVTRPSGWTSLWRRAIPKGRSSEWWLRGNTSLPRALG